MGFPIARMARRAAFIGAMIGGGLLAAGIAQAQAQDLPQTAATPPSSAAVTPPSTADDGQPTTADRQAELIAATGGPAPVQYLMAVAPERPAVETRDDDVEDAAPDPADSLNAAEVARDGGSVSSDAAAVLPAPTSAPRQDP